MAGDNHGIEETQDTQAQEDLRQQQTTQDQPQVSDTDWEKAVAERDEKIAALEAQVAEAAKNVETAERLRGEIAELKAQGESDRIEFEFKFEPVITVADGRVSSRSVRFKEQLGSWKGLRFTYGKNMAGCTRTVLEQDVYTALYGFGAGLPVTDEDGRYTRRPASKPS